MRKKQRFFEVLNKKYQEKAAFTYNMNLNERNTHVATSMEKRSRRNSDKSL